MICAWEALLSLMPQKYRKQIESESKEHLQEIRLRTGSFPELVLHGGRKWIAVKVIQEDLEHIINAATHFSPWTAGSLSNGYITAPGGHRIGLCGEAVRKEGKPAGFRSVRSLCIRVAKDYPGISERAAKISGSILILGAPGSGKTTLLRDLIRLRSQREHVCVVDERRELFPQEFETGTLTDILTGVTKTEGIQMLLRSMGPDCIAVDEITAEEDCRALAWAANCGVKLIATAHAGSLDDYYDRKIYEHIRDKEIFRTLLLMSREKTFTVERAVRP